jgi:predicted DNA-binding transcriptional regulator AlpA
VNKLASDTDGLLVETEAAQFLSLSVRTLQAWRHRGIGPSFIRAGRAVRYRRADILGWIADNTVSSARSEGALQ